MEYYSFMSSMVPLSGLMGLISKVLILLVAYVLGHYIGEVVRGRGWL